MNPPHQVDYAGTINYPHPRGSKVELGVVEWDDSYNVGIEAIDEQHVRLIGFINELLVATNEDLHERDRRFKNVLQKTVEYVMTHFRDEEALMLTSSYPQFKDHKIQHEEFMKTVLKAAKVEGENQPADSQKLAQFLRDWLLNHIGIKDKEFARFYLGRM